MRHSFIALNSMVALILSGSAWAEDLNPQPLPPGRRIERDAAIAPETCGKPPSEPGNWKCMARKVTSITQTNPTTHLKETFNRITVTWTDGGKTMQDSWDAK
jgi:hypothetical protein